MLVNIAFFVAGAVCAVLFPKVAAAAGAVVAFVKSKLPK